jgi:hypothetical protein
VVDMARAKEHGFSVEMKSKVHVRRMSVSDNPRDAVIFEGANGTLRIDLSEEELRKALAKKKKNT